MVSIYIAGKFQAQERLQRIRAIIHHDNVGKVVSSWLDEPMVDDPNDHHWCRQRAMVDLEDIKMAGLFILDTLDDNNRGGREVEWGYTLTRHIDRWIVGPYRNVFHRLSRYRFDTWDEAILALGREYGQSRDAR